MRPNNSNIGDKCSTSIFKTLMLVLIVRRQNDSNIEHKYLSTYYSPIGLPDRLCEEMH